VLFSRRLADVIAEDLPPTPPTTLAPDEADLVARYRLLSPAARTLVRDVAKQWSDDAIAAQTGGSRGGSRPGGRGTLRGTRQKAGVRRK
jgi:hypothetical protein